jgi:hypothetical protein
MCIAIGYCRDQANYSAKLDLKDNKNQHMKQALITIRKHFINKQ